MQQIYVKSQLNRILFGLLGSYQLVDQWWNSNNHYFDGKTPNEIYWSGEQGKRDVASYIFKHYDTAW